MLIAARSSGHTHAYAWTLIPSYALAHTHRRTLRVHHLKGGAIEYVSRNINYSDIRQTILGGCKSCMCLREPPARFDLRVDVPSACMRACVRTFSSMINAA